jgi:hypothetical protein
MSFADPSLPRDPKPVSDPAATVKSVRVEAARRRAAAMDDDSPGPERPRGSSYRRTVDWQHVGLIGAGLVVGALIGVGAALLFAPQSGEETRAAIRRGARGARLRAGDAWDDLADDIAAFAHRGRRRMRRGLRRARWRASDAIS